MPFWSWFAHYLHLLYASFIPFSKSSESLPFHQPSRLFQSASSYCSYYRCIPTVPFLKSYLIHVPYVYSTPSQSSIFKSNESFFFWRFSKVWHAKIITVELFTATPSTWKYYTVDIITIISKQICWSDPVVICERGMRHTSTALYFYGAFKKSLHKPTATSGNMLFHISYGFNYYLQLLCLQLLSTTHLNF